MSQQLLTLHDAAVARQSWPVANPATCQRRCVRKHHRGRRPRHVVPWRIAAASSGEEPLDLETSFEKAVAAQQALEDYRIMMQQPDDQLDLLMAATLIAQHRYPLLEHDQVVEQLDDLAVQIEGRLPDRKYPMKVLQAISVHLYEDRGFAGNRGDYYDPDNSCINRVLETRRGIPITLSLVYMEVARRLGLPLIGVNVPGHFFLGPADPDLEFLIDAFNGGEVTFLQDAEATLARIYKQPVKLDPAFLTRKEPVPPRLFLSRMLNNLKQVYVQLQGDFGAAYAISQYMRATQPGNIAELRDSGVFLFRLKRYSECIDVLTEFLARAPADSEDAEKVRKLLQSLEGQS